MTLNSYNRNMKVETEIEKEQYLTETYVNGESWYRVYSDNWCEQGGNTGGTSSSSITVTLLKPYRDTDYNVMVQVLGSNAQSYTTAFTRNSTSEIVVRGGYGTNTGVSTSPGGGSIIYRLSGYIA